MNSPTAATITPELPQTSAAAVGCSDLVRRLDALEARLRMLEEVPATARVLKAQGRKNKCHWAREGGQRFWIPMCYGGIYGKDGCTCR